MDKRRPTGLAEIPQTIFYPIGLFLDLSSYQRLGATASGFGQIMSADFLKGFFVNRQQRLCRYRDYFMPCEILSVKISSRRTIKIVYQHEDGVRALDLHDFASFERAFPLQNDPTAIPRYRGKIPTEHGTGWFYELGPLFYPRPNFSLGALLDAMDDTGVWYEARVVQMLSDKVLVRFCGWGSSWDTWFMNDSLHLAPFRTFTLPWRHQLDIGTLLEFRRPNLPEPFRWHLGVVEYFDSLRQTIQIRPTMGFVPRLLTVKTDSELICPLGTHTPSTTTRGYRQQFGCMRMPQWHRASMMRTGKRVMARVCMHENNIRFYLFLQ